MTLVAPPSAALAVETPRRSHRLLGRIRALGGERLVQFAVLGGALFALAPKPRSPEVIQVTSERLAALHSAEAARPGAKSEAREGELDQRAIEDELLYREGIRLGLDKNDGIVRQRVVQKVLFLAEELGGASRPIDEGALRAFFEANRDRWAMQERHRFTQIYRHDPQELAAWIAAGQVGDAPSAEPAPVGPEIDGDTDHLTRSLGKDFADAIAKAPVGTWTGPVRSAFGWHLVRVIERAPARPAKLEEVRGSVVEAYSVYRRQEATAAFVQSALARYKVTIDDEPLRGFAPSRRIAFRSVSSGED